MNKKAMDCVHATWTVTTPEERAVYLVGNTRELGEWNTNRALPLHSQRVGSHLVDWNIDLELPGSQAVEFKFIQKSERGDVIWEGGENRVFKAARPNSTIHWGAFR